MTIWKPDTCNCIANVEEKKLITHCKIHNTYEEMRKFNRRYSKKEQQIQRKALKDKT